jgi:class 3 adenylate cyclase
VRTIGDAVMAACSGAARAVAAALGMRAAVERFDRGQPGRPVLLQIGVHHGAAIAVAPNDGLDCFGQTVDIASRVQAMAGAQEICVTAAAWTCPGVGAPLAPHPATPGTAEFQGVGRPMAVVRVRAHAAPR